MLCAYCNTPNAEYQQTNGKWCCCPHYSQCPSIRAKNAEAIAEAHKDGRCVAGFDGHRGWRKGKSLAEWGSAAKSTKRRQLLLERGNRCECCGNTEWMGKLIPLECHNHNAPKDEAKLLCPNCHAQTDDWRRKK